MRRSRSVLWAAFAVCVASAGASSAASALEFYVEHKLIQGLLNIDSVLHSAESILKWEISGAKVEITCPELHNTGWIHNGLSPSGVLLGLGLIAVHFLKCVVPVPASEHCKVVNELILATSLVDLGTIDGETYALFSPDPTGSPFVRITFEGCKQAVLNTSFPVNGEAVALASNPGLLIFKEGAPNNKLKIASNPATLIAEDLVLMEAPGVVIEALGMEFYVEHELIQKLVNIDSVLRSTTSKLKGEAGGVKLEISCPELHNTGWIHNGLSPSGVLLGLGLITVHFLKCTVPVPESEHCSIANGGLILAISLVDLGTSDGETYALFSPDPTGSPFVRITFEGCKQSALNTSFPVTGEAVALASNPGLLIFKEGAPNNKLKFASNAATLIAEDLVLMEGTGTDTLIEAL